MAVFITFTAETATLTDIRLDHLYIASGNVARQVTIGTSGATTNAGIMHAPLVGAALMGLGGGSAYNTLTTLYADTEKRLYTRAQTANGSSFTTVAASASSVQLLASNVGRFDATFYNDSTATCYLLLNSGVASTSNFTVKMLPGSYYELPHGGFSGVVNAIWDSATGNMRITELTY